MYGTAEYKCFVLSKFQTEIIIGSDVRLQNKH